MPISPVPIKRDAFLYIEGPGDKQCGTCWLFNAPYQRCKVLPPDLEVGAFDSCGYYGYGSSLDVLEHAPQFTPEEVGFVSRAVRCENCYYFGKGNNQCNLFYILNGQDSDLFQLDTKVAPEGCCNAQTPRRARVVT